MEMVKQHELLIAAFLLSVSILYAGAANRYQATPWGDNKLIVRIDGLTGSVVLCRPVRDRDGAWSVECLGD